MTPYSVPGVAETLQALAENPVCQPPLEMRAVLEA